MVSLTKRLLQEVDTTYSSTMRVASLGVVARNTKVEIDCSAVTKVADVESPLQAELMAIVFGLHMAKERNFRRVQLESDSLIAITEILKKNETV